MYASQVCGPGPGPFLHEGAVESVECRDIGLNDGADTASGFFGSYQLLELIGEGGMAKVYRARHTHPLYAERPCALKLMHSRVSADAEYQQLFRDEAYLLSQLRHPGIVRTYEAGYEAGHLFVAMEHVDGRDLGFLSEKLRRQGERMPEAVALYIVTQLLGALAYAHQAADADGCALEFIHRDVNPYNLLLSFDGEVKLGDFGTALIRQRGRVQPDVCGKIGYFAPEQLRGKPIDQRADIFAAGVVLYELLCGRPPFGEPTSQAVLSNNQRCKYRAPRRVNPELSRPLAKVIERALAPRPNRRYPNAEEMRAALEPSLPSFTGIELAAASLLRTVFAEQYQWELTMRAGLAGELPAPGRGKTIGVCSRQPERRQQFTALAAAAHYSIREHDSLLGLASERQPPDVAVVDVAGDPAEAAEVIRAYQGAALRMPIVVVTQKLGAVAQSVARTLGATDLLYDPVTGPRFVTALWAATNRTRPVTSRLEPQTTGLTKILIVSQDDQLAARLLQELPAHGYQAQHVTDTQGAEACHRRAVFHGAVFDAGRHRSGRAMGFADALRSAPGVGLLPVVYLADGPSATLLAGIEKSATRERNESALAIARALDQLRSGVVRHRCFARYPVSLELELFFGGRGYHGRVVDISRGGLGIISAAIPIVGSTIRLVLRLPNQTVAGVASVARVVRPVTASGTTIGVEMTEMGAADELALVAFIDQLAAAANGDA